MSFLKGRGWQVSIFALIGIWAVINLMTLLKYPVAQCDEGYYSSVAVRFIERGVFGTPLMGNILHYQQTWPQLGRLYLSGLALIFKLFGVGLWQARFFGFLGWGALIALTYAISRTVHGDRAALWSAAFIAFSPSVFLRMRFARPEIWLSVLLAAQIFWYLHLYRNPSRRNALILGILMALGPGFHLNAIFFGGALGLFLLWEYGITRRQWGLIAFVLLGGLIGGSIYLGLQLYPSPAIAISQYTQQLDALDQVPGSARLVSALTGLLEWLYGNFIQSNRYLSTVESELIVIGIVWAARRRDHADKLLLTILIISLLGYTLIRGKSWYHAMMWFALGALFIAGGVSELTKRFAKLEFALAPLMLLLFAGDLWLIYRFRRYDYTAEAREIQQYLQPDQVTMAESSWYLGLYDTHAPVISDFYIEYYFALHDESDPDLDDIEAALRQEQVHNLVIDGNLHCKNSQDHVSLMLERYAEQRCDLQGTVTTPFHDISPQTRVYYCPLD